MSTSKKEHKDVEAPVQEPRNTIDVSTFEVGDMIKFKNGSIVDIIAIEKEVGGYTKLHFLPGEGSTGVWAFKNDGTARGDIGAEFTIIAHSIEAPKYDEAPISTPDPVAHPAHYTSHPSGIECIQVTQHMNFNLGNVVKYVWRNGLKDSADNIQDLKKAQWYLSKEIERLEKQ